jgi:MarR-like DNA-binding transcriptional regulator SgrR of sgrS sRNA
MQELQTLSAPKASPRGTVSGRNFNVLFTLAGSDSMDVKSLGDRLGMTERECRRVVEDLQSRYLLDVVSGLDGEAVRETLRLTEEGEAMLLRALEQMCELPELSRD